MSALIWVAIVAVWGFVLIPMWLRRHDTLSEQRSAERFTVAMRVLSRRPSVRDESVADRPGGDEAPDVVGGTTMSHPDSTDPHNQSAAQGLPPAGRPGTDHTADGAVGPASRRPLPDGRPSGEALPGRGQPATPGLRATRPPAAGARPAPRRRVSPERAAAMRARRQRLILLGALFPVTVVLALVFGQLWYAVQLIADLAIGGYLVHLRRAAQGERRLEVTRAAIERRIESERAARSRRRPVGSSFAYRERDAAAGDLDDLTPDELAHAQAETIDLGVLMARSGKPVDWQLQDDGNWAHPSTAAHHTRPTYQDQPAPQDQSALYSEAAGYSELAHYSEAAGYSEAAHYSEAAGYSGLAGYAEAAQYAQPDQYDQTGYPQAGAAATAYGAHGHAAVLPAAEQIADAEVAVEMEGAMRADGAEVGTYRAPARPAGRAPSRPPTSRPGRVQVNPPGTHGGLTAPPAEPGPAVRQPTAAGSLATPGEELDDPLLRRHAVGS